jgi:Glycosyl hydrolase catalytic core/Secretion system C-terminal sorting domain/F5/8 type C domain
MKNCTKIFIFLFTLLGISLYGQTSVVVENQKLTIANLGGNNYTVGNNAELRVSTPIAANGTVNLTSDSGWLILDGIMPSQAIASHLGYITVNGQPAVNKTNVRVTNYLRGCVIMAHSPNFEALTIYKDVSYSGDQMKCIPYKYYKIAELGTFDNTVSSFKLKKGYMATFAQNENGTGYSKVFIAENDDVQISTLQNGLNDNVSFIRVFPWRFTEKKGFGSGLPDFNRSVKPVILTNSGWFYHWGTTSSEDLTDVEFVPTRWNAKSLTDTRWKEILDINYSSHLLGFNEPDGESQANMTLDEMLLYWPKMLESGLRLGSPAMASDLNLLYSFIDKCDELNYRVDFVAMHDYGEGTALSFYNKCKAIHDRTGRPIWIKEFNWGGTWTKSTPTYSAIAARITEIMEKYDTEGIIERYSIFSFDETVNNFGGVQNRAIFYTPAMPNYTITPLGVAYRDNVSPMAYNPAEAINIPMKLVAPQNLKITNINGTVNKLVWDNFNFSGIGTVFIERASGISGYVTVGQISSVNNSYDDDITSTGLVKYTYRLSVRQTGYSNSKFVTGTIDLSPSVVFNVALKKPVTASSTLSTLYPASNAVDGNSTSDDSRWVNQRGMVPAFLEVDLQGNFLVSQIKIFTGFAGSNNPLTNFTFDYWDENTQSWIAIVTETSNSISSYSKSFSEVKTNKVRLYINAASTDNTVRLYELEVYGRIATLGTSNFTKSKISVYPNPTSDIIHIVGAENIALLQVLDVNGKSLITQKDSNSVDVTSLANGVYFIKFNNSETFKFIKK